MVMTIPIRVVPLPSPIADEARRTGRSPGYGHPAHVEVATGYGPCRQCLRKFRAGEERRLLFTFDAFAGLSTYPQPGPIFIHEEPCAPWEAPGAFPDELRELPLTLEAYGRDRWPLLHERVARGGVDEAIQRLLSLPAAEYLHLRNSEAGCYIARVERAGGSP
jgi:hypothetical protein